LAVARFILLATEMKQGEELFSLADTRGKPYSMDEEMTATFKSVARLILEAKAQLGSRDVNKNQSVRPGKQ